MQEGQVISAESIRKALYNNEFFLEYLPIMSLEDNRCVGCEALIRWRLPDRVVPPKEFIPLAENTPLSGLITYWVIEKIGEELGEWVRQHENIYISVNVPPEVVGRGGVEYAAAKANLLDLAHKFVIEVTERGLPDSLAIETINSRTRAGVYFALDDVGITDANLVILARMQIDMVKIDKSFLDLMLRDDWSPDKIFGLSRLVEQARFLVVAEGVETKGQVEIIRNAGIKLAQGWFFSRPLAAKDFLAFYEVHE